MRTKYYKDDIIEIINSGLSELVGMRYYVVNIRKGFLNNEMGVGLEINHNKYSDEKGILYFPNKTIILYKRPFKNWIKNLLNL